MESNQVLVKTIKKSFDSKIKAGIVWFKFILAINDIKIPKRQLELLAYINYRGTISSTSAKEEFCKLFSTSSATISNMTSTLIKKKLLIKEKSKIKIHPTLKVDFDNDFVVRFFISVNSNSENNGNRD